MNYFVKLAKHIDDTFGSSIGTQDDSRAFVKIFKELLTEEEAQLILKLEDSYITASELAPLTQYNEEELGRILIDLAKRGFIFEYRTKAGRYYKLMNYTPGLFEAISYQYVSPLIAGYIKEYVKEIENFSHNSNIKKIQPGFVIKNEIIHSSLKEVSLFLDKSDCFAVSDCLCRIINKEKGHECGHPIKDMCLQTGQYAEYFINTGHSRRVSKEEAIEILKEAEQHDLFHEIYPIDYNAGCAFICNCCRCGCLVLRASKREQTVLQPMHAVQINQDKCLKCGQCFRECPEDAISYDEERGQYVINPELCFNCGMCSFFCQSNAIS